MSAREWAGVTAIATFLLAMLVVLRFARSRVRLDAELSRKGMHLALGASAVAYPWLFRSALPAFVLAAATIGVLLTIRLSRRAHGVLGGVVDGVARASDGELYFPVAVATLFWLSRGDRVLFLVPVLTLTLADATAALIGVRYGQTPFVAAGKRQTKSLEGSSAFVLVAYFSAHIPLALFSSAGKVECLLIAATFALLVMLLEAVAWRGLDNLFIPIGGFWLLRDYLPMGAAQLVVVLAVTAAMLAIVVVLRRRRTLTDGAGLLAVLFGYVAWSLGGWRWILALLVLFMTYTLLWPRDEQVRERPHDAIAIASVEGASLLWLAVRSRLGADVALLGFCVTLAAHLAFIGLTWFRVVRPRVRGRVAIPVAAAAGWLTILAVYAATAPSTRDVLDALLAFPAVLLGTIAFARLVTPTPRSYELSWVRQAALALGTAALGAGVALHG